MLIHYFQVKQSLFKKISKKIKKISKNVLTSYEKSCILKHVERTWSLSSAGRASALQAGGHRFEPCSDHHVFYGPVVQLVRTLACHARGRRFEPVPGRHFFIYGNFTNGFIAQLVEQRTENPRVSGSIPLQATIQYMGLLILK